MKSFKMSLVALLSVFLLSSSVLASSKGSGHSKGSAVQKKGSAMSVAGTKSISVSGKIKFIDYYELDGKKCAAILETEDQTTICIIDNMVINNLKKELDGKPGHVKVFGKMTAIEGEKMLKVEEAEVVETKGSSKGSGHELKDSTPEPKGSH